MVRIAKKPKQDMAKMYRHFAAVTIGVTALVGVMAEGETEQALLKDQQERAEKRQAKLAAAEAEAISSGNRKLLKEGEEIEAPGGGSFGPGAGVSDPNAGIASSQALTTRSKLAAEDHGKPLWKRLGIPKEMWDNMDPEQRRELIAQIDPNGNLSNPVSPSDKRSMLEKSRLRAGGSADAKNSDAPPSGS